MRVRRSSLITSQHCAAPSSRRTAVGSPTLTVALAGPPNVGKSSLFNRLTGLSQHVGNWTGKTVDRTVGECVHRGTVVSVIDLPGAYSLSANSAEEEVARDCLAIDRPDVVVVVVSAPHLERTLYQMAELSALGLPIVIALNMMDVAHGEGIDIDVGVLSALIGCPVVPIVASTGLGLSELMDEVIETADTRPPARIGPSVLSPDLAALHARLGLLLDTIDVSPYQSGWVALKLLEGDQKLTELARHRLGPEALTALNVVLGLAEDAPIRIASARYEWIAGIVGEAQRTPRRGGVSLTATIDRMAANLYVGPALLIALLGATFWVIFKLTAPLIDLLDLATTYTSDLILGSVGQWSPLAADFLASGIVGGVGTVLSLVPIVALFYLAIGTLEDVGYMARAAYVVDAAMHRIGLHGKSFLPMFLGFGCNVPAVLGARILESPRARLLTVLLTPFVPCSGRMIVVMFVAGAVYGPWAPVVTFALLAMNIAVLIATGLVASRVLYRSDNSPFVMEMPLYHLPNWRGIALVTWHHIRAFVTRAGSVILLVSVVVWLLSTFPGTSMDESFLASIGHALAPVGALMGLDWRSVVSLISSFVAKENALATLSVLTSAEAGSLADALPLLLSPASAAAFLVAQMLFVPCVATVTAVKQETGSWRVAALSVSYHMGLSFAAGVAVYQALSSLGFGR